MAGVPEGPPDAAATLRAYSAVESFIRGTSPAVDPKGLPAVYGCSVVLRLAGEVVGRGSSIGGPGAQVGTDWISAAAGAAWAEAEHRLPASRTGEAGALMLKEMRQGLLVSLELAGPLMRINGKVYGDFDATLQPGLDGVLASMDGKIGAVFPGAAAAVNVLPSQSAQRAVAMAATAARGEAGGGATVALTEPAELEKKHGVTLYRFRTAHVAQWRADKGPELLYRGQKLVDQQDVDGVAELWHIADRLAGHLANRADAALEQTVALSTGISEPAADRVLVAAATKFALDRYLRVRGETELAAAVRARVARWEATLGEFAASVSTPAADAGLLLGNNTLPPEAVKRLRESSARTDTRPEQSLIAYALVAARPPVAGWPAAGDEGRRLTRQILSQSTPGGLATHMPWIGWSELELRTRDAAKSVPSAPALREMRTLIWKHQLQAVDAGPDGQDMVGGIVVPGSQSPLPTWQTARLVAFLGTMLGEPELTTPQERPAEVVRLLAAARFLRQLQVDDALGWMCRDAAAVKGSLRNATWDQRTQEDATAMALLAVLEIVQGIEKASAN